MTWQTTRVLGRHPRRVRLFLGVRHSWRLEVENADEVFAEKQIKRPIQGHAYLLLKTRQLNMNMLSWLLVVSVDDGVREGLAQGDFDVKSLTGTQRFFLINNMIVSTNGERALSWLGK